MTLHDLVLATGGDLKSSVKTDYSGVVTDSRNDVKGKIFFALKGDVHDSHNFLKEVSDKNAAAIVSHKWNREVEEISKKTTVVLVEDTLKALQVWGSFWRKKWGKKVIGVTGSNGKTSVKDFAHTLVSGQFTTLKSEGSLNNHWGVPLTLLRLEPAHDVAIVEMGMNHHGEITELCKMALPNVAVVTNVGRAHGAFFDGPEDTARAKAEIYETTAANGIGLFNLDNVHTKKMYETYRKKFSRIITFGAAEADIFFTLKSADQGGLRMEARLFADAREVFVPLWGAHNVINLMTAAAMAKAIGVESEIVWKQLEKCKTGWGRNQWIKLKSGSAALFDGYNANPESFMALLKNLEQSVNKNQQILAVFGEMREQGTQAPDVHRELGYNTAMSRVNECYFVGESAMAFKAGFESAKSGKKLYISNTYEDSLALKIKSMLSTNLLVVVKGSRGGALERVVMHLDPLGFTNKQ